jgi:hypothetical protein
MRAQANKACSGLAGTARLESEVAQPAPPQVKQTVRRFMGKLSFDVQEFLYMRDVENRSFPFIASMFGMSWRKLIYEVKKAGIDYQFKKAVGGSQERYCKLDRIAHEHGYNNFEHLLAENRPTKSQKEIAELFGVSLRSVAHRTPEGVKGWYRHFTNEAKEKQLTALSHGREKTRIQIFNGQHIWQRHNKTCGREISINNFNLAKAHLTKRAPDSLKAGVLSLPESVKVENVLPAESG